AQRLARGVGVAGTVRHVAIRDAERLCYRREAVALASDLRDHRSRYESGEDARESPERGARAPRVHPAHDDRSFRAAVIAARPCAAKRPSERSWACVATGSIPLGWETHPACDPRKLRGGHHSTGGEAPS